MLVMKNLLPLLSIVGFLSAVVATPLEKRAKAQVFRSCTVPNTVALTFDDGPYIYMNDLINTLNKENVKATFFFNGNNWACIYNDDNIRNIKRAYDSGHQLGSHTWSHKDLTTLSWDQMHDEMWRVEQAILRITGALPAFVRPPYGNYNDLVLEAAGARGLTISNWDFDSEDGKAASIDRQKGLYDAAVKAHPSTILSLEHEVHATSVYEVLPYAIAKLRAAGYRFVTVAECLNMKPYQLVLPPSTKDASWKC
ncbi:carbohydrate esterase family 4 protein [Ephemerocybe angulata]|uniref:Carbohydrate esterase family 4 protein n=1 Tax=Ephemerocybe angulata TaxID=980116 RepID=A0A8H6HII4_9AGAR|nr:carbohydrate esterase family 4 protein [Tulosesus angulatus]